MQTTPDYQYQQRVIGFFLCGFLADYRIWENKYIWWMKTVKDGNKRIDMWMIRKPTVTTIALITT
jgi:hypothetical protein